MAKRRVIDRIELAILELEYIRADLFFKPKIANARGKTCEEPYLYESAGKALEIGLQLLIQAGEP